MNDLEIVDTLDIESCQTGEKWSDYIFRILYKNIMNLTLYPGMTLNEPKLVKRFGCSRTPVREAFLQLQRCHLVDIFPQCGIYVSPIDYDIIRQMQFMRASVESQILTKLCQTISSEYLAQLNANLTLQIQIDKIDKSGRTFFPIDKEFHRLFYKAAGFPMVEEIMERCITHNDRLTYLLILNGLPYQERSLKEHQMLYDSIVEHDTEKGLEVLQKHRMEYQNLPPLDGYEHYFRNASLLFQS